MRHFNAEILGRFGLVLGPSAVTGIVFERPTLGPTMYGLLFVGVVRVLEQGSNAIYAYMKVILKNLKTRKK